ncbi:Dicer-like protein 2 [Neocucurbitaria cava]|uniref:Dicer-like protein 2 n=1 Tax=Neocucurbitaria cava TaxID=798079 RepID=A0A9W8Y6M3_9PLEO|nr:Dicer-like protein 2 [Neocucurbitaria cava]
MSDFFIRQAGDGKGALPKILGLSASPVKTAKATAKDLQQIEQNLHATAKTPKIHRSDLMRYVYKPELIQVHYHTELLNSTISRLLCALEDAYTHYDLMKDPFIMDLLKKQQEGYDISMKWQKTIISQKTYCHEQLRTLVSKAKDMAQELGTSAMEWYLHQCIVKFEKLVQNSDHQLLDWTVDEKRHLLSILERLPSSSVTHGPLMTLDNISSKVTALIDIIVAEMGNNPEFTGLVFVEQRVWVAALAEILSVHPRTRDLFRVGSFIGTSQSSNRKTSIASLPEPKNQQTTLEDFRAGRMNLILATSVLEEGIDVSSCHLVIDFEAPKNLKSFVQRRGRARKQESKYFIFTADIGNTKSSGSWQSLEAQMKATYEDDMRRVEQAEACERESEDGERFFEVTRTGWRTERMARKDAAFEGYKALYHAGLVNDNLLPFRHEVDEEAAEFQTADYRPSMVPVSSTFDPWLSIARYNGDNPHLWYRTLLEVCTSEEQPMYMVLLMPGTIPALPELILHWNEAKRYTVKASWLPGTTLSDDEIQLLRSITWNILQSVLYVEKSTRDFLWLLAPCDPTGHITNIGALTDWHASTQHEQPALEHVKRGRLVPADWGLVTYQGRKYILKSLDVSRPERIDSLKDVQLHTTRLPKRRDFLHPVPDNQEKNDAYTKIEILQAAECTVACLPISYSIFALLLPSILYRLEVQMITDTARTTILKPISFEPPQVPILVTALTSSATGEEDNYEKLEFLGDTILKFVASVHLMAKNLNWPESYLTGKKGKIVSNAFLSRATLASGLDQFIITKRFTGAKWRARYISQVLADTTSPLKEERSSKVVADVIESLIGASYVVGGLPKAFVCMQTLLPLEDWTRISDANQVLFNAAPSQDEIYGFEIVERLIGYTFTRKSLLVEALTHASYTGPSAHCSYERLEFLGDAVLDYIVTTRLFNSGLSHHTMHLVRAAIVTASFLTYSMFETTVKEELTNKSTMQPEVHDRALWQFLRSGGHKLLVARDTALKQYMNVREQIAAALEHGATFPWHLLALVDAPKFLSDIVESVIGAVYVDSHGDISACEVFVRRLGLINCVDRILCDQVDVTHPKVRLGLLAVEKDVKYVQIKDEQGDDVSNSKLYRCRVKVGGTCVGGVVEGTTRLSTETIAAFQAVEILEHEADTVMDDIDDEDVFVDAEEGGGIMLENW